MTKEQNAANVLAEELKNKQEQSLIKKGSRIEIIVIGISMLVVGYFMGKHGH